MSLVYGRDAEVASWVAERIPNVGGDGFGPCAAIGVADTSRIPRGYLADTPRIPRGYLAGVVYHDYQPKHRVIQLSMAASNPMWARRENIAGLLAYPFLQLDVFKCWIATERTNEHALKTWRHIGWRQEAILAHQFGPGRHAVVMRMLKPDFLRLYGEAHG